MFGPDESLRPLKLQAGFPPPPRRSKSTEGGFIRAGVGAGGGSWVIGLFVWGVLAFVIAALGCIAWLPQTPTRLPASSSVCLRLDRKRSHVVAQLQVGSPAVPMRLLVVFEQADGPAVTLHSPRAVESATMECAADGACVDRAFFYNNGASQPRLLNFTYQTQSTLVSGGLGLDGELRFDADHVFELSASLLCWASPGDPAVGTGLDSALEELSTGTPLGVTEDGVFTVNASALPEVVPFSPARGCDPEGANATLFPLEASADLAHLAISDSLLSANAPDVLHRRRRVVEMGRNCASRDASLSVDVRKWDLDCASSALPCPTLPSVPLLRATNASFLFRLGANASLVGWLDPRLAVQDSDEDTAVDATVALLVLLVCSGISYVRSNRPSAAPRELLFAAIRRHVRCEKEPAATRGQILTQAVYGLLIIGLRAGALAWRSSALWADGSWRVVTSESISVVIAGVLWAFRYVFVKDPVNPLTLLGGSTSLFDAAAACLLIFSRPPLLAARASFFPRTGVLLSALLINQSLPRASMALASLGVVIESDKCSRGFRVLAAVASILWTTFVSCLGVTYCDLFVISFVQTNVGEGGVSALSYALLGAAMSNTALAVSQIAREL